MFIIGGVFMETSEIMLDGKKIRVITRLSDEEMEDTQFVDYEENTLDLSEVAEKIKDINGE